MAGPLALARQARRVFADKGARGLWLATLGRALRVQPIPAPLHLGSFFDYSRADLVANQAITSAFQQRREVRTITWYLPPYSYPMAGISNIYSLARHFRAQHGVQSRWVFCGEGARNAERQSAVVARHFPEAAQEPQFVALGPDDLQAIPACDASVATYWSTAYLSLKANRTKAKFYLVQDYEPLFFPAGTEQALAEETYRFGFARLCVTPSTHAATSRFPGPSHTLNQCVDRRWNQWPASKPSTPVRVVFYGRPYTPRNGFRLGLDALRIVKRRLGDRVEIVSMGQEWDPATHGVEGVVRNLGVLPREQLGETYRSAHVGLALMFGCHPSLQPLEYWANGIALVTNDNEHNRWLLKDGVNCLISPPAPSLMADAVCRLVEDAELRDLLAHGGRQESDRHEWADEAEGAWRFLAGIPDAEGPPEDKPASPTRA